jgi:hypothetical protein
MWGSLLALALLGALNPIRISLVLLMISRPRPLQNLFVYWLGLLTMTIPALVIPLLVLHFTPGLRSFEQDLASPATAASSTVRHIQIGTGVLALAIAAFLAVRFWARRRARLTAGGNRVTEAGDPVMPAAISRLLGREQGEPTQGRSAIRRQLDRVRNAWEDGSVWVAFVLGVISGPAADGILYVLAIIAPSGATLGTQVGAAITFVFAIFAVVEVMLASHLVAPAKTQAVVRILHDWVLTHRRKIVVAIFAVLGVSLVAQGIGSV